MPAFSSEGVLSTGAGVWAGCIVESDEFLTSAFVLFSFSYERFVFRLFALGLERGRREYGCCFEKVGERCSKG